MIHDKSDEKQLQIRMSLMNNQNTKYIHLH